MVDNITPGDQLFDAENDDDFLRDDDHGYFDEEDRLAEAQEACGQVPGQGCMKIGTEECDQCPFHHEIFKDF
jgi:hypothetical protein